MTTQPNWIKSSHSGSEGNCIEVAAAANQVLIRDSNNTYGPVLAVPAAVWQQFTRRLAEGNR